MESDLTFHLRICKDAFVRFDGQKLRKLREARNLDQHELASRARLFGSGVTQSTVSRLEGGTQEPTLRTLSALAGALDVAEGDLLVDNLADDAPFQGRAA